MEQMSRGPEEMLAASVTDHKKNETGSQNQKFKGTEGAIVFSPHEACYKHKKV